MIDGPETDGWSPDRTVVDGSPPTVLAVDDEPELAELYRVYLDGRYDVRIATGGEKALDEMDDDVDVVLLDRRMPDRSGHEVLAEIRDAGYDARVAMLTAVEPDVDVVDMPFDDYRIKPVSHEDLVALVEALLERAAFDERSRRFFALASKKAALEAARAMDTEEYEALVERTEAVRAEVGETLDRLSAEHAFVEFSTDPP